MPEPKVFGQEQSIIPLEFSDQEVKRVKIRFVKDTPLHVNHVVRSHCGRLQHRPYVGVDSARHGEMETYFPAGTVIEISDFISSGFAEVVTE